MVGIHGTTVTYEGNKIRRYLKASEKAGVCKYVCVNFV